MWERSDVKGIVTNDGIQLYKALYAPARRRLRMAVFRLNAE
jgi:hypothetical protein